MGVFFFLSLSKHRFSIIALKFYQPDNIAIMYKCLSTLFIFLHDICTLCSFRVCLFENMYSNCIVPIMYHFLYVIELFVFFSLHHYRFHGNIFLSIVTVISVLSL